MKRRREGNKNELRLVNIYSANIIIYYSVIYNTMNENYYFKRLLILQL